MKPVKDEKGFALVIALIVTTLLVALLVEFVDDVFVDVSHSHNFVDSQQASILAESGIDAGIKLLQASVLLRGGKSYSSLSEPWAKPQMKETDAGTLTVNIEEESGKLDLNSATSQTGTPNQTFHDIAVRLLTKLQLSQDLYDSLADWADTDDTPRPGGGETSYYLSLKPPYQAHNNRLDTMEELALVRGYTPEVLAKLRPCVTVYGSGDDFGHAPTAKININTAPKELLAALDDKMMRGDLVDSILDFRKNTPITSENLSKISGMETLGAALLGCITFQGTVYRIRSEGRVGETVSVTEAVVTDIGSTPKILYWREY